MKNDSGTLHQKLREVLFRYRATPLSNNKTPAEQYFGRNIRTKLDAIKPMKHVKNTICQPRVRQLTVGDRVQTKCVKNNTLTWVFGTILEKIGKLHYRVILDNDFILKRHINQLRRTEIPKTPVAVEDAGGSGPNANEPETDALPIWLQGEQNTRNVHHPRIIHEQDEPMVQQRPERARRPPIRFRDYVIQNNVINNLK
ncbi:uncharacterized protein K02A2.6-like [Chrysoperla carnea]|uniref:uncharacterized protein K02A2.6-like n=1 Tax=Chrysoperla carnea TaxID=189513 RepID=UPI001D084437|nr:uncharacterized protein K02A2.6-like [Chrysoperla carnea]